MQKHRRPRPAGLVRTVLCLAASFLFISTTHPSAARPLPKTRVYSESSGLPSAQVRSLATDESGCIWALTRNGLTIFDGQDMTPVSPPAAFPINTLGL
ncbi:MAG: hypothetical protein KDD47_10100, partial [Acidobacteria bacterium]|nr:hypothetical protein [Acidobacteriota bacterium]